MGSQCINQFSSGANMIYLLLFTIAAAVVVNLILIDFKIRVSGAAFAVIVALIVSIAGLSITLISLV